MRACCRSADAGRLVARSRVGTQIGRILMIFGVHWPKIFFACGALIGACGGLRAI